MRTGVVGPTHGGFGILGRGPQGAKTDEEYNKEIQETAEDGSHRSKAELLGGRSRGHSVRGKRSRESNEQALPVALAHAHQDRAVLRRNPEACRVLPLARGREDADKIY